MKIGLSHCNLGEYSEPEAAIGLARAAEEAGVESIWTVEHVILPEVYEPLYPETPDGRFWFDLDIPISDPLTWMSFVAAATSQVHFGTGILILPQRNPLITAKELATLDRLSGGRLEVGVGAGWLREEFDALGVGFEDRGKRLDEYIAVMRELWQPGARSYDGPSTSFSEVWSAPSPTRGAVPIHVGGFTKAAARRAGRLGDGFFPGGYDLVRLKMLVELAREEFTAAGRRGHLEITARWTKDPDQLTDLDQLSRLREIGVDRVVVPAQTVAHHGLERTLAVLGEDVIPAIA